jgi:hypothetical protein
MRNDGVVGKIGFYLKAQLLPPVTPGIGLKDFTLCLHGAFKCFIYLRTNSDYFPIALTDWFL